MKKRILLLVSALFFISLLNAQQHKIVYDLVSADTSDHSTVLRQFNNILKEAPDAELEVVCHGQAIYMFVKDKAILEEKMKELVKKAKISFKVCANSMRRYGVDKSQLIPLAEIVPVAMLELSSKQQQGWSYIKAGH